MKPARPSRKKAVGLKVPSVTNAKGTAAISDAWRSRLIGKEKPLRVVANALIALRCAPEWQGVLHFDESSLNTVVKTRPPWDDTREPPFVWTDEDDIRAAAWLQHQDICASVQTATQAVQTVARENPFHPIRDYLDSLTWDGIERIDFWLPLYLGADPSEYNCAIGAKWLIGAVARAYQPGCKCDSCMILEGPQGTLKSTALRTLADPWFTDDMPELGTKDSALQLRGIWIIELSELDAMKGAGDSRVKAFMSRNSDRFRPPYGKRAIDVPRECIFAGTVNHDRYLKDETGGRRFWPVQCGDIDIDGLRSNRDQLWAEARERFLAGEIWWLEGKALVDAAAQEVQMRYDGDPWDEKIADWIKGRESVSVSEVLELCLEKNKGEWAQRDQNRVARSLRAKGWERYQQRTGPGPKNREHRYRVRVVTSRA